jgi:CBS domain-containing protein
MKSVERCRPARPWFEEDDEPTAEIYMLSFIARPVVTLDESAPIDEAHRLLSELRVSALAIVDAGVTGEPVLRGILTRTDLLRALGAKRVADAMSGFPFTLPAEAPIERAAALMAFECVGQVMVTGERGRLVGMVSALDITRFFAMRRGYRVA